MDHIELFDDNNAPVRNIVYLTADGTCHIDLNTWKICYGESETILSEKESWFGLFRELLIENGEFISFDDLSTPYVMAHPDKSQAKKSDTSIIDSNANWINNQIKALRREPFYLYIKERLPKSRKDGFIHTKGDYARLLLPHQPVIAPDVQSIDESVLPPDKKMTAGDWPAFQITNPGISSKRVIHRDADVANIISEFDAGNNVILLHSKVGGTGKTTLAHLLSHRLRDRYALFAWIPYYTNFEDSILNATGYHDDPVSPEEARDPDLQHEKQEDRTKKRKEHFQALLHGMESAPGSKLIVIDNVDLDENNNQNPAKDAALNSWLSSPSLKDMLVIITSRLSALPCCDVSYNVLPLGSEDKPDGCVDLFMMYYEEKGNAIKENEISIIKKLIHQVNYHTLLIEILAKTAAISGKRLPDFADDVDNLYQSNILSTTGHDTKEMTPSEHLINLFQLSRVTEKDARLLFFFSCLPPQEGLSVDEIKNWFGFDENTVMRLLDSAWLQRDHNMYSMHPLIRESVIMQNVRFSISEDELPPIFHPMMSSNLEWPVLTDDTMLIGFFIEDVDIKDQNRKVNTFRNVFYPLLKHVQIHDKSKFAKYLFYSFGILCHDSVTTYNECIPVANDCLILLESLYHASKKEYSTPYWLLSYWMFDLLRFDESLLLTDLKKIESCYKRLQKAYSDGEALTSPDELDRTYAELILCIVYNTSHRNSFSLSDYKKCIALLNRFINNKTRLHSWNSSDFVKRLIDMGAYSLVNLADTVQAVKLYKEAAKRIINDGIGLSIHYMESYSALINYGVLLSGVPTHADNGFYHFVFCLEQLLWWDYQYNTNTLEAYIHSTPFNYRAAYFHSVSYQNVDTYYCQVISSFHNLLASLKLHNSGEKRTTLSALIDRLGKAIPSLLKNAVLERYVNPPLGKDDVWWDQLSTEMYVHDSLHNTWCVFDPIRRKMLRTVQEQVLLEKLTEIIKAYSPRKESESPLRKRKRH